MYVDTNKLNKGQRDKIINKLNKNKNMLTES